MKGNRKNRGWLWITRDASPESSYVIWAGRKRPRLKIIVVANWNDRQITRSFAEWRGEGQLLTMCARGFERVMQYRLSPGACEKVSIALVSLGSRHTLVR